MKGIGILRSTLKVILFFFISLPVAAQDFHKGVNAFEAGDYVTALKEWRPFADQGVSSGQYNLAIMYDNGWGIGQDHTEAIRWYKLAAEQGHTHAQYNLALMYEDRIGVATDYAEARKWHRLAAEQGHGASQNNLAVGYEYGEGVLQNYVMAYMWYKLAASNGSKGSSKWQNEVALLMTPEEISNAQIMARECVQNNYQKCGY